MAPCTLSLQSNDGVAPVRTLGSTLFFVGGYQTMDDNGGFPKSHGRSWSRPMAEKPWMPWMPWKHLGAEVIDLLSRSPTTCGVPTATVNLTRPVFGWPMEARFWPNWTIRLSGHVFLLAVPHINQQQWGFSQISPAQSDTNKSRFKQSNAYAHAPLWLAAAT